MSRYHSYQNSAVTILSAYRGEEPFAGFLKKAFAANKKYGSKDRKSIAHLCYGAFRTGKALLEFTPEERVMAGLFLCTTAENEMLAILKPEWNGQVGLPLHEKLKLVKKDLAVEHIFPWGSACSDGLAITPFAESFLVQPDLFLRVRPGKEEQVRKRLENAGIAYTPIGTNSLALSAATKLDTVLAIDKEVIIQDYSSQKVADFFPLLPGDTSFKIWDCCAASGGKSLLAKDLLGNINLTVSDLRETILLNLKKRFLAAGIHNYKTVLTDLSRPDIMISGSPFDLVIADVPCTGSGTWSRTPEQLFYFEEDKIEHYATLQRKILDNVVKNVRPGGFLLYSTCSVFRKENEDQVRYLVANHHLQLVKMDLIKGFTIKADSMFAALLQRPL